MSPKCMNARRAQRIRRLIIKGCLGRKKIHQVESRRCDGSALCLCGHGRIGSAEGCQAAGVFSSLTQ